MKRTPFLSIAVFAAAIAQPAQACRMYSHIDFHDVRYADLVVVGRISNYRIIRDEASRQERLKNPNLSAEDRERYQGDQTLLWDYARFEIDVEEVLVGNAPQSLSVTWDNSTFSEPKTLPPGPYLIALRRPSSSSPPLRGPSATLFPNPEPDLYTLLQAPCSSPFMFEDTSNEASAIRQILRDR